MSQISSEARYRQMVETPLPKLIWSLAIPTIISMLVSGIYNMADTYFVSLLKSDSATAAVGVMFSLMALIQAMGFTLGMGSGSLISRLLGQQRKEDADRVVSSGFAAAVILGLVITILGTIFLDPLMNLLGATPTILPYARSYGRYILFGAPVMAASFVMNNALRSEGHATLSMVGITTGGILNMILDPLFIFTFDMGIAGAAIATLASQCVSFLILLFCFLSRKSILRLSIRNVSLDPRQYGAIITTGFPSLCRQGLASIASVALNHAAVLYGDAALAAISVVGRVLMLLLSALLGFGQGYQPVVGFNYGAKRYDRVRGALAYTVRTGTILAAVLCAAAFVTAPFIISRFGSGEMVAIGTFTMRAQCLGMILQPMAMVTNMTYQSVGKPVQATFLSACRQGIFFLPLIAIMPRLLGLTGVQLTMTTADVLTGLVSIPFLLWFFRDMKRNEAAPNKLD